MENRRRLNVLKRRSEFLSLKKNGKSIKISPWLLISYKENSQNQFRCGWTVSKKVGSAVVRNRLKRWCREFFRDLEAPPVDFNVIFLSRNKPEDKLFFKELKHHTVNQALNKSWRKVSQDAAART